jgi:hypothetical protein
VLRRTKKGKAHLGDRLEVVDAISILPLRASPAARVNWQAESYKDAKENLLSGFGLSFASLASFAVKKQ